MTLAATTIHIAVSRSDWGAVLPELITSAGLLVMLLLDVFLPPRRKIEITSGVTLLTLVLAFLASWHLWSTGSTFAFYATVTSDQFSLGGNSDVRPRQSASLYTLYPRNRVPLGPESPAEISTSGRLFHSTRMA